MEQTETTNRINFSHASYEKRGEISEGRWMPVTLKVRLESEIDTDDVNTCRLIFNMENQTAYVDNCVTGEEYKIAEYNYSDDDCDIIAFLKTEFADVIDIPEGPKIIFRRRNKTGEVNIWGTNDAIEYEYLNDDDYHTVILQSKDDVANFFQSPADDVFRTRLEDEAESWF